MKKDIHPKTYPEAEVYCNGELVMKVRSTKPRLNVDVWSGTHPFYTGEQRIIDTAGQVDRFMRRLQSAQQKQETAARRREERNKPEPKKPSLYQELYGEEEGQAEGQTENQDEQTSEE